MDLYLKTRISRPKLGQELVRRDDLIQRLEDNSDQKLIIISAAAGFGKTTLVSQWLENKTLKHAWISLDQDCDHLNTFLIYFIHAIDKISPGFSKNIQQKINFQALPDVKKIIAILTNELIDFHDNFILVLDDYQWIKDKLIHQVLSELIEYPPSTLHLVLISRRDPPLILDRMRIYNQMHEIRDGDLTFKLDEILELYRITRKEELKLEFAQHILQITEGWIAGVRYLFLKDVNQHSFDKIEGATLVQWPEFTDYFRHFLHGMFPQASLGKLLVCSILDEFSLDLVDYVSSTEIENIDLKNNEINTFYDLTRSNFFIVAIDEEKNWYRFHQLLKDVLFLQLKKIKSPAEISQLHQRAACWFDQHGYFFQSVKHAISSRDMAFAIKIFNKYRYREMENENWTFLNKTILRFPKETIYNSPLLLTTKAFCEEYLSNWEEVDILAERIMELVSEMKDNDPDKKLVIGEIKALQSICAIRNNQDFKQAISYAREALATLPSEATFIQFYALLGQSIGETFSGKDSKYISTFKKYRSHDYSLISKSRYNGALGLLSIINGNLGLIQKVAKYGMRLLESVNTEVSNVAVYFHLFSCYQRNKLEDLPEYYQLAYQKRHLLRPFYYAQCAIIGSFVEMVYGNTKKAWEIIDEAEKYIINRNSRDAINFIQVAKVELALKQGDFNLAESLAVDVNFRFRPPTWEFISPLIVGFNLIVNRRDYEASEAKLQELITLNKSIHHIHFAVSLFIYRAGFFWMWNQKQKALDAMYEAIQISKPGHYIRSFLDLGRPIKELLIEYTNIYGADYYTTAILDAFGKEPVSKIEKAAHSTLTKADSKKFNKSRNELTNREKDVITQLAKGFSNKEIAQALFISELTVKKHMSNIFSKLDVKNRQSLIRVCRIIQVI